MLPHTVVVDFAVALLITSLACDLMGVIGEEPELRTVGAWTLWFGAAAAAFAVVSGLVAAQVAPPAGPVFEAVLRHRNAGIATALLVAPPALWRFLRGGKLPVRGAWLYWALVLAGTGTLTVAAWLGGVLVFRHGVGVALP